MEKIEFYKVRSLGERFSAGAAFLRQNWKVLFKNILLPAIPFVLFQGYFSQKYLQAVTSMGFGVDYVSAFSQMAVFFIISMVLTLFIYAMSGAIMSKYNVGELTDETGWSDLSSKMFSNMGRGFLISLLLLVLLIGFAFIIGSIAGGLAMITGSASGIMGLIMALGILAFFPPLMLAFYPAYFREFKTVKSIASGFRLGFKNWGSTFGVLFICGVITAVLYVILSMPYQIWVVANPDEMTLVSYILSVFSSLTFVLTGPVIFVFLAFQYFAISEKEEGVSLQSKVDEFDSL